MPKPEYIGTYKIRYSNQQSIYDHSQDVWIWCKMFIDHTYLMDVLHMVWCIHSSSGPPAVRFFHGDSGLQLMDVLEYAIAQQSSWGAKKFGKM